MKMEFLFRLQKSEVLLKEVSSNCQAALYGIGLNKPGYLVTTTRNFKVSASC